MKPIALILCYTALALIGPAHSLEAQPAANAPQSIADLAPAPIPDEDKAAAQIDALAGQLNMWDADYTQFSLSPIGLAYDEAEDRGEPPTAEQAAAMQEILNRHVELDEGLRRAAACDKYASRADFSLAPGPFIGDLFTRIQRFRSVGRFVGWQIRMLSHDGQHDEAVLRGVDLL